jgi:hypothetical protein
MKKYLCNETFSAFAAENYNNIVTDPIEFHDDLDRIKYIKRLFNKYRKEGDLKERLVVNHLIILYNVFEPLAITKMLFYKLEGYHEYLKPFLVWLRRLPEEINNYTSKKPILNTSDILMDDRIVDTLRKISNNA